MEAYYYSQMNKLQQSVYHGMKSSFLKLDRSVLVPWIPVGELQEIFFQLRLDCPEIFYAVAFQYRFYRDGSHVEVIPEYLFNKKKVKEHEQAMNARVAKLARAVSDQSEREKEQYIHDFICTHVRYDKLKKPYSHEIIGPLGQGVGVCEGIAKTVKMLCDALGIWCIIAISEANPEKEIKYRHAWNVIRIEGQYYQLDVTFDNTLGQHGLIRYDYFNLDDQSFFKDHEPALYEIPNCVIRDQFYYREQKRSFTKMEEVIKRAQQALRKKVPLTFHWRGGHLSRQMLTELLGTLEQMAQAKQQHVRMSLNWAQAVISITFVDQAAETEFIVEDANEGELLGTQGE